MGEIFGGGNSDSGQGILIDVSGNVLLTGIFTSPSITFGNTTKTNLGQNDIFLVKYDASGNILWAKFSGGLSSDIISDISTDASSNIVVTGYFLSSSITFGKTTLTKTGSAAIFVAKYDASGNLLWAKSEGGTSEDMG